ncbi:hypothetical protein BT93_L3365 [Corymbia citriodora subsp. variegata]|uniref:Uncharacterized protein n=1 Tax=Corymbia citriodora subsp. variegata TaxID=360336 RepID=A0A8T0CM37_CORYI|nr:hypothetical protein BT93_L3365 [Corymbia citriodora subsp. variegata]
MENNSQQSWQFSDQLCLANLSLNDFAAAKLLDERRNFDTGVGGKIAPDRANNNNNDSNTGYNPLRSPVNDGCNAGNTVAKGSSQLEETLGLPNDIGSGDFNEFKLEGSSAAGANLNDLNRFDDGWKVGGSQVNASINVGDSKVAIYGEQPLGYSFIGNFMNPEEGKAKIKGGKHRGNLGKSGGGYRKNENIVLGVHVIGVTLLLY